jgi:hypothetical protein
MKVRCPHCGSSADSMGSYAFSNTRHEFTFRCISNRCRKTFTGKIELSLDASNGLQAHKVPSKDDGVVRLRDQNVHLTDC